MERSGGSKSKVKTTVFNIKYNGDEDEIEIVQKNDEKDDEILPNSAVYTIESLEPTKQGSLLECEICGRNYTTLFNLKKHIKTCTKRDRNIGESCEELSMQEINQLQKSSKNLLKNHICYCCEENLDAAHTGHIRCQDCPKSFKTVPSYRRHVSFIHSSVPNARSCNVCNAKCPTHWVLQLHLEAHRIGKPFACQTCGKEFTRRYHLVRHQKFSNCDASKKEPPKSCNICGKEFFRIDNLKTHLRQHIGEQSKSREYNCPYCEKGFVSTTTLNIHVRTHTGEKPFLCDVCKKGFPSNGALRKHRRSHTGEKPFKCQACQRCFGAKEVLNRHMKTHTGVRPHVCKECGKAFIQATQLTTHMFHHTGESAFACAKCDHQFSRKKLLSDHIADFHSDKADLFDCNPCLMCFKTKPELIEHMRVHLVDKLFKCQACDVKFLNKSLHPKCSSCKLCSKANTKPHQHVSEISSIKLVQKKRSAATNESSSSSSQDGKPRKLKILTSKQKKIENSEDRTVEIIIVEHSNSSAGGNESSSLVNPNKTADEDEQDIDIEDDEDDETHYEPPKTEVKNEEEEIIIDVRQKNSKFHMDDDTLNDSIAKLLNLLLDAELLQGFGWPSASIEHVLSSVIQQCGHKPADYDTCADYSSKIRENAKLLFTVVVDNDSFKHLLNNYSIDEVIQQILQMIN